MADAAKLQRAAKWIAIAAGLLGLTSAIGVGRLPEVLLRVEIWMVFLLGLGLLGGRLTVLRSQEIEKERWRVLAGEGLTSGEREYAHRHAEQERRGAATAFLLAPTLLGVWLSYQTRIEGRLSAADLLPVIPMLAFLLGLWIFRQPEEGPPEV